ncbi:FxSxx-COOH system tetratricopeptide repeat protein [Micromonospora sp. NPDC051141]|uniref:FxSxx-COOH system tetratricopeptide repeat protein n=1 Tax=Micromonospora sp. NPDC051141 TaxID=3364284 RepID=UPI003789FA63
MNDPRHPERDLFTELESLEADAQNARPQSYSRRQLDRADGNPFPDLSKRVGEWLRLRRPPRNDKQLWTVIRIWSEWAGTPPDWDRWKRFLDDVRRGSTESSAPPEPGSRGSGRAVWNVSARNPRFVGRDDILQDLRAKLQTGGRVLVQAMAGMGGVGKTQIAREYAHRFADFYSTVWWIRAERDSLIGEQFAELAVALELVEPGSRRGADIGAAVRLVMQHLRTANDWLLIFDNVISADQIEGWLPGGRGHVLITSRNPAIREVADVIDVSLMQGHQSTEVLASYHPALGRNDRLAMAAALGNLPLALAQAATFLRRTGMSASEYLDELASQPARILDQGLAPGYADSFARAVLLTVRRLVEENPAALGMLRTLAFLSPEPVPFTLLQEAASVVPAQGVPPDLDAVRRATVAKPDLLNTVAQMVEHGLVERVDRCVQVHRLVQDVLRSQLTHAEIFTYQRFAEALVVAARPGDPSDPVTWRDWATLFPHILIVLDHPEPAPPLLDLACDAGWFVLIRRDMRTAPALLEDWFLRWTEELGRNDPHTVSAAHMLALAHRDYGRHNLARALDQENYRLQREWRGPDHPNTLHSAASLASDLSALRNFEAARQLNEDTYRRRRQVLGEDHPDTLASMSNLAVVLHRMGEYSAARDMNRDVLQRRRAVLGERHPDTLTSISNLAVDLRRLGETHAALELNDETVRLRKEVLGLDHPDTLVSESNRADLLRDLGRQDEALAVYRSVLERRIRVLGEDHQDAAETARALRGEPVVVSNETPLDNAPAGGAEFVPSVIDTGVAAVASLSLSDLRSLHPATMESTVAQLLKRLQGPSVSGYSGGGGGLSDGSAPIIQSYANILHSAELGRPLGSHSLTRTSFNRLARGHCDRRVIDELSSGMTSHRMLLLVAVLLRAKGWPSSAETDAAVALIDEARQSAPRSADRVITSPQVGAWLVHVLRHTDGRWEDDLPSWVVLGHLQAVAAVAGIVTHRIFDVHVPVWEGMAALPTLGVASFGDSATGLARVRRSGLTVTVTFDGCTVTVPPYPKVDGPGWTAIRNINERVILDPLDRYLQRQQSRANPVVLADADMWARLLDESVSIIRAYDADEAEAFQSFVRCLVPLPPAPLLRPASSSSSAAHGYIAMSPPDDPVSFAGTLLHELQHLKFGALHNLVPLFEHHDNPRYYAPWRDDPRPLGGLLNGTYAFTAVARFWHNRHQQPSLPHRDRTRAAFECGLWQHQVARALSQIRTDPHLTTYGHDVVTALTGVLDAMRHEASDEIADTVSMATADHWAGWRAHHLQAPGDLVHQLAERWTMSRNDAGTLRYEPQLRQRIDVPALDARAVLMRWRLARPERFHLLYQTPSGAGDATPDATVGDVHLVAGDMEQAQHAYLRAVDRADDRQLIALVGLGLALRAQGERPAADALLTFPELVGQVAEAIRTAAGVVPPIPEFAGWLSTVVDAAPWPLPTG